MITIVTPISLDAMILTGHTVVKDAMANYSLLPYSDKTNDYNPDTPYLGAYILNHPFQDKNLLLGPGVHLHWSFPTGLSKTIGIQLIRKSDLDRLKPHFQNDGVLWPTTKDFIWNALLFDSGLIKPFGNADKASIISKENVNKALFDNGILKLQPLFATDSQAPLFVDSLMHLLEKPLGSDFPTVPDVWLIRRKNADTIEKNWIVESSYMAKTQTESNHNISSVNIPFHDDQHDNKSQPFRFLGRRVAEVENWSTGKRSSENYLEELTAVGYNAQYGSKGFAEPTFAAFYPNCLSVFGFYDAEITAEQQTITYEVLGLYAKPENDYLKIFLDDFSNRNARDDTYFKNLNEALFQEFQYTVMGDIPLNGNDFLPANSLLFGKATPQQARLPDPAQVQIAVGNTGTEALSAYLASQLPGENKRETEELLEAVQFSARLQNRQLDIGHKFQEARHAKGFTAIDGGNIWNIKMESVAPQTATEQNHKDVPVLALPDELAVLLNEANTLQSAYDKLNLELTSLRSQLYADWYKYMSCSYPPVDQKAEFFDDDILMEYIRSKSILPLQEKLQSVGTVKIAKDENERLTTVRFSGSPGSIADKLAEKLQQLMDAVISFNKEKGADGKSWLDKGKCVAIRQVASPRFWRPNDPAVLFIEKKSTDIMNVLGGDQYKTSDKVECRLVKNSLTNLADFSFGDASELFNLISSLFKTVSQDGITDPLPAWNPFMLEWEVEYLPAFPGSSEQSTDRLYDDQYINLHYDLKETMPDLSLTSDSSVFNNANLYTGSTILTPHAGIRLNDAIKSFIDRFKYIQSEDTLKMLGSAGDLLKSSNVLSQSLGGFHEALLLRKQTRQLDVADPLGFPEYASFTHDEVAPLVGKFNRTAPDPSGDFNPIRCGLLKILNLRLVDAYGLTLEFTKPDTVNSEMVSLEQTPATIHLRPRLSQPARLNFRFLSASSGQQEMNAHPVSSPVCGWLLPNHLDQSLMFYDQDGTALGALTLDTVNPWKPAPDSTATAFIDTIDNIHLRKVAHWLFDLQMKSLAADAATDTQFLSHFLAALNTALETISPENFSEHQDMAVLMGRPIAVVRAKLSIELYGPADVDQSWTQLAHELHGQGRSSDDFTKVKFLVRLGEYQQLNDGLLGYWTENQEGRLESAYTSSEAGANPDPHILSYTGEGQAVNLYRAIDDAPLCVTMLADPMGSIHVTSGILPVKSVSIPKDQYKNALKRIAVTFLTAPVLSIENHLKLSLPKEPGYAWTWLEKTPERQWQEIPQTVVISRSVFDVKFFDLPLLWQQLVAKKWLEPLVNDPGRALVTSAVQRAFPGTDDAEAFPIDVGKRLDNFFDTYARRIEPFAMHVDFGGPLVIREGWLQLGASNNTGTL